ncbi:hypothetical protein [Mesorhizobium sp. WSM3224]|uniref:hypothetical protein n=1 Tax=Mesorhizobium sp. WSM3224 TaxID=1040986 RepID=UPI00040D09DA|nr:hypothetical protein [Mesorhizobium sp. WSM3224]
MAKDKFTVDDLEQDLRSREAKASLRKSGPSKRDYPNADRYGEDGRRIYSAYDATPVPPRSRRQVRAKRIRLAAIVPALIAAVLVVIVMSALPH